MKQLVEACSNRITFHDLLCNLETYERISDALRCFQGFAEDVDYANAAEVIHALFTLGDELPQERLGPYAPQADYYAYKIVNAILLNEEDVESRSHLLQHCLRETDATWFPTRIVAFEHPTDGEEIRDDKHVFNSEGLKSAALSCVGKIKVGIESGKLVAPRLPYYLHRWRQWGEDEDEPGRWVREFIRTPENAVIFASAMLSTSYLSDGFKSWEETKLSEESYREFVSSEDLQRALRPLLVEPVPDDLEGLARQYSETLSMAKSLFDGLEALRRDSNE